MTQAADKPKFPVLLHRMMYNDDGQHYWSPLCIVWDAESLGFLERALDRCGFLHYASSLER